MEDVTLNKVYGAVFGFTVGDALGVPVEFMMRKQLKMNPVIGMREFGTHNQPKGTWKLPANSRCSFSSTALSRAR